MEIDLGVSEVEYVFDVSALLEAITMVTVYLPITDVFREYYKERIVPEVFSSSKGIWE